MKRAIVLLLTLLLLAACARPGAEPAAETSPYQLLVSSADLAPGASRLALTLWDGPNRLTDVQEMQVRLYQVDNQGAATDKVWEGPARSYMMGDSQYWVLFPEFPRADYYGVQARFKAADGKIYENRALLQVRAVAEAPIVGQQAPPSETRTLDDAPVEQLTSAPPYNERFYQMSVAEVVASGKPSIIVFATPGYCSSQLCAPVVQTVETVSDEFGDQLNVVHVEIYRDFPNELDPSVREWNLPSEPWVFVVDAQGAVGARLDGLIGEEELREAVQEVLGG